MKRVLVLLAFALSGCGSVLLSDNRLASETAGVLGQPPASVVITDRRDDAMANTYYVAHTPRGTFACSANGGGILDAGIVVAPTCNRM